MPAGAGSGAAATLVPALVPGTLLSQHNLLTICFSMSSTILASNLHVSWDTIGCSLCSSEDQLGVPAVCRGSCALLPPTLLPYSNLPLQVFTARVFEALFSLIETLGCTVCLTSQLFLPAYPYSNVGNPIHQPPCPPKVASHCLANSSCPP